MCKSDEHEAVMKEASLLARRSFLLKAGMGLGSLSLLQLLGASRSSGNTMGASSPSAPATPAVSNNGSKGTGEFPARAKRVINIALYGGISQIDTLDYKPTLVKMHGQEIPASVKGTARTSSMVQGQTSFPIVGPIAQFRQSGKSGAWISDLLPYTREVADDLCIVKTVYTDHVNHDPAGKFLQTGYQLSGRPAVGAWVTYALGSDNANLPAFIVLKSAGGGGLSFDAAQWGAGFLPSNYQGVIFGSGMNPVQYVKSPDGVSMPVRRMMLDMVERIAKTQYEASRDPEVLAKLNQYEMSYRMQSSVPEVADISEEPDHILDMYGPDVRKPGTFARNCLLARRLAERGVKYISLIDIGWDHHSGIVKGLPKEIVGIDQPQAALIKDLKQRGLLDDTLVVWGSEFGRTSFAQGALTDNVGRDHHAGNCTYMLAGGGVKPGFSYGETDDFSYNIAKNPVHIHDLHATMLYILGIDFENLKFKYQGRDFKLTDVSGRVVKDILA